jgi:hypothetical protein
VAAPARKTRIVLARRGEHKEVGDGDGQAQVRRGIGRGGTRRRRAGAGGRDGRGTCYPPPPPPGKAKCNAGNGNGSETITFVAGEHCYGGDPGNSYNAGNRGGDEIPTSGGVPNPGGNNVP